MVARDASGATSRRPVPAALAALAILAGAGCAVVESSPAQARAPASAETQDLARLEEVFWYCDFVATTQGVLAAPMTACKHATDELKARKFGGRFRNLLAWWEENKAAEHDRLRQDPRFRRPSTTER